MFELLHFCVLDVQLDSRSESANQLFDEDDLSKQKNQRMATLLGFSTDPSREALLEELVKKGILAQVRVFHMCTKSVNCSKKG